MAGSGSREQQRVRNPIKTHQLIFEDLLDHAQILPNLAERETFQVLNESPTYRRALIEIESAR
jgi:hypothetical protein